MTMQAIKTGFNDSVSYIQTSRPYKALAFVGTKIQETASKVLNFVLPRNEMTNRREIRFIPVCIENYLGSACYDGVCPKGKICNDEGLVKRVNEVFAKLIDKCPRKSLNWEIRVMQDDETVNAFCLPGGKVVITTAMIKKLEEKIEEDSQDKFSKLTLDDHLAAVLGHEIVHAAAGHGARKLQWTMLLYLAGKVASYVLPNILFKQEKPKVAPANAEEEQKVKDEAVQLEKKKQAVRSGFSVLFDLGTYLLKQQHSQGHELESDKYGIKLAHDAGYNIHAAERLMHVFLHMKGKKAGESSGVLEKGMELFSTHPCSQKRLEENEKTVASVLSSGVDKAFA